ncbi:MAG: hypothetical protein JOZ81_29650 [Chloroflexi bacterium]|nr:hypothetical protein [Chloroflexota bacterium]MBV9545024.1 hypothetical protein [Chloroflexota bacterium]
MALHLGKIGALVGTPSATTRIAAPCRLTDRFEPRPRAYIEWLSFLGMFAGPIIFAVA